MAGYLVRCDCSHEISVGAGQAGGTVSCSSCGRCVSVPKLRDLAAGSRAEPPRDGAAGRVSPAARLETVLRAAALIAALSLGASWLIMPGTETVKPADLRNYVAAMDEYGVYFFWTEMMSKAQARRMASPEERSLLRRHQLASVWSTALLVVGGIATAVAFGTGMTMVAATSKLPADAR